MKTQIAIQFTIENKMKAFSSKQTQVFEAHLEYSGMAENNSSRSSKPGEYPGLVIFDHSHPVTVKTIISGGDQAGRVKEAVLETQIKTWEHVVNGQPSSMDSLMSAPVLVVPLLPAPFMISFFQVAPHSTRPFNNFAEYRKFITEKLTDVQNRVSDFNSRFNKPLKNGKITSASFSFNLGPDVLQLKTKNN